MIKPCFSREAGHPTKELFTMLGVLLLQQAHDLTDEETVSQLAFNIQWHYVLNLTEESDGAKYLCLKTLWTFRQLMIGKERITQGFPLDTCMGCPQLEDCPVKKYAVQSIYR
ncbi:transposase [uncultured Desulfobacter sp.]|uniref:transposase n=1 Tax=uncultured Desulfobacter sp. TaxID=240139 RepID=UPI002AA94185|nr:transposase [uncultured Desulfobacter sp.]